MKFLSVRDLRGKSAQVWRELLHEKEMVITNNGRPVAVLTAVDESTVEKSLAAWRQVRATQAISSIQQDSLRLETDKITPAEIDSEIKKSRQARRKRTS